LNDASAHLERNDAAGVLGALDGIERDLSKVRCFVSVTEDFGPKEKQL
jgi:hypothetical protein